jgi:chromosome segregation ATPase
MAKQEVTTQIDELVSYLKTHGETSITDLSKALVVGESTLNDWASILEKAGMVKVVYKAGRMFLSPVEATTSESGENVSRIIQAEKEDIQSEVNSQQALLNQITSRINSLQGLNDEINKLFSTKYKDVMGTIKKINTIGNEMNDAYKNAVAKKREIDSLSEDLRQGLERIDKEGSGIASYEADFGGAEEILSDLKKKADEYNSLSKGMVKEVEAVSDEYRKRAIKLSEEIKKEKESIDSLLSAAEKELHSRKAQSERYAKELSGVKTRMERNKTRVIDDVEKSKNELYRLYDASINEIKDLSQKLESIKGDWNTIIELDSKVNDIEQELKGMQKSRDEIRLEIDSINRHIMSLTKLTSSKKKDEELNKITQTSRSAAVKLKDLNDKVSKAENDMKDVGSGKEDTKKG